MATKLLEFENYKKEILRGILVENPDSDKNYVVVMLGGFERSATSEKKFKALADKLALKGIASFRFDAPDCGLSDGDFYPMTTESLAEDLRSAVEFLKRIGYGSFAAVGHSLAGCVISLVLDEADFKKIVLLAPALNQRDLLRLWFVQNARKDIKIDWNNYKEYFREEDFIKDAESDMTAKSHMVSFNYRIKNQERDYSRNYESRAGKVLLVHGRKDDKVPLESLGVDFPNKIILEEGDHDLERPEVIEGWLDGAVQFLLK